MLRAIREILPRWIVGENVLGIVNWSKGLVFEQVCADLETEGYEVQPYVLPAAGVGALHQRYRTWFVAHSNRVRLHASAIRSGTITPEQVQPEHAMPSFEVIIADDFGAESNKHGVVDGIPEGLDECSLHAYGNAVVPQVVYQIFETINEYEALSRAERSER